MKEISAGGIVIEDEKVLILKQFHGSWVLPKGRRQGEETLEETALREVWEESGMTCRVQRYLGYVCYNFQRDEHMIHKTVHYFRMEAVGGEPTPLADEGFCQAAFIPQDQALKMLRFDSERSLVQAAFRE